MSDYHISFLNNMMYNFINFVPITYNNMFHSKKEDERDHEQERKEELPSNEDI